MRPYIVVTKNWKVDAYKWFKHAWRSDPVPLFVRTSGEAAAVPSGGSFGALPASKSLRREPLAAVKLQEHVESERITVRGCVPGSPVLIRISYHPRWRAATGERVWLAGPGFMLVFPERETLELVYGDAPPPMIGRIISFGALLVAAFALVFPRSRMARRQSTSAILTTPARDVTSRWPRILAVGLCISCGLVAIGTGIRARRMNADAVYLRGLERLDHGQTDAARTLFQLARATAPLSNTAIHSSYFEGVALYRASRWADARRAFSDLVERFPEAQAAAESLYHVGLCDEQLGATAGAMHAFLETERRFPGTQWAQLAASRRAKIEGA
jgi:hypothetical protein